MKATSGGAVSAAFVTSAAEAKGFPKESLPELAMVGRSNVGKSSLINGLVRQSLARTSAAPARHGSPTSIAFRPAASHPFSWWTCPVTATRAAVARPGRPSINWPGDYFSAGRGVTLLLVDSRHPGLDADIRAWTWLVDHGVDCHVVATKVDKLTQSERKRHVGELERRYSGSVTPVSALTGEGLEALWTLIAGLLRQPPPTA